MDCSLYEHRTVNYKRCQPNYGGFISPTHQDTDTEQEVGNGRKYYSQLEYDRHEETTRITLMQCPQHASIIDDAAGNEYTGGNSPIHSCFLRRQGECVDNESEYCNSGGDFKCPSGFKLQSAGAVDNTFNDCEECAAGDFCTSGTVSSCPSGYQCPAYSFEQHSHPA